MRLYLPTSYRDVELLEVPGLVVVDLTQPLMRRIRELQAAVEQARAYQITEFNYEPEWTQFKEDEEGNQIPGEPMRTECNELVVADEYFFWQCYAKHSDVTISTECVYFNEMDKFAVTGSVTAAINELLNMADFAMNVNSDAWPDGKEAMNTVGEFLKGYREIIDDGEPNDPNQQ